MIELKALWCKPQGVIAPEEIKFYDCTNTERWIAYIPKNVGVKITPVNSNQENIQMRINGNWLKRILLMGWSRFDQGDIALLELNKSMIDKTEMKVEKMSYTLNWCQLENGRLCRIDESTVFLRYNCNCTSREVGVVRANDENMSVSYTHLTLPTILLV